MTGPIELPPLPDGLILMVEVGSTAHGTGIAGQEDYDQMGVVAESPEQLLGLAKPFQTVMHRTRPEGIQSGPGDIDRTLYPLRRFLSLAVAGNPSILNALWSPIDYSTPVGDDLRTIAGAFAGRHVIARYKGYMKSQAERLVGARGGGHGKRGGGRREDLVAAHGYDTKYAMHCARLGYQGLELVMTGRLTLPMVDWRGDWLRAVRRGEVPFEEWWDRVLRLDETLCRLEDDPAYRAGPDLDRINLWMVNTYRKLWFV